MKLENLNKIVTGNWYIRNNLLYIEIKRKGREVQYSIPIVNFKYISEERITDG